jgi:hypothetical protein
MATFNNDSLLKKDPKYYSSDPNDHKGEYAFNNWDDIFELQARKDGSQILLLKTWLKKYFESPKLKMNETPNQEVKP